MNWKKSLQPAVLSFFSLVLACFLIQCQHDGLLVANLKPVCYDTEIAPIFLTKCAGCHDQNKSRGGIGLYDYNSILKTVTPYNAQKSKSYLSITGKGFAQLMPPGGALSENDRILIRVWIDQGAKNTVCYIPPDDKTSNGGIPVTKSGDPVCFKRDILPVLLSSCGTTGCHDQNSRKEGYVITSYASVMANMVKAGQPNSSRLYTIIANNNMPPSPYAKLTQATKDSIYNWIKNGALDGVCASSCDTATVVTYQNQISSLMTRNCTSCHSGANAQKGIALDTYAEVKAYLDNGKLLSAVKGTSIQMPPGYSISSCEMRQLELWKANGAKQN
jgi:uncharacterized membrane protein